MNKCQNPNCPYGGVAYEQDHRRWYNGTGYEGLCLSCIDDEEILLLTAEAACLT